MSPDQEPLRRALATNDALGIIHAVTAALNWCRDEAARALRPDDYVHTLPSQREGG